MCNKDTDFAPNPAELKENTRWLMLLVTFMNGAAVRWWKKKTWGRHEERKEMSWNWWMNEWMNEWTFSLISLNWVPPDLYKINNRHAHRHFCESPDPSNFFLNHTTSPWNFQKWYEMFVYELTKNFFIMKWSSSKGASSSKGVSMYQVSFNSEKKKKC